MNRAYSIFEVKSVDDEQRIIEGLASTPEPDRMGDILESAGATFKLPMPLLWQHKSSEPIGQVIAATVTKNGISIKAKIAKDLLPRIEESWALIKSGLVRGLSVGFRPIEAVPIDPKDPWGGLKFSAWEWMELSAVTIPANASATIQTIKSLDVSQAAAGTAAAIEPGQTNTPAVAGTVRVAKTTRQDRAVKKPIADQIKDFEATRAAKVAEREALQTKVSDEGRNKDQKEREDFDTLTDSIEAIDAELKDLRTMEASNKAAAMAVKAATVDEGSRARGNGHVEVHIKENLAPGQEFARMVMCKLASFQEMQKGNFISAAEIAKMRYPDSARLQMVLKAAVGAGVTEAAGSPGTDFAAALVYQNNLAGEFVEFLRPQTIIGRIPGLRNIPFNVRIISQSSGADGYWVGEGAAKPLTSFGVEPITLLWTKLAAIAVITQELARFSSPSAEMMVRDELSRAIIARSDIDFVDPNKAEVSGISPASITNGITPVGSSGTDPSAVRTDMQALFAALIADNLDPSQAVLIMPSAIAMALSLMQNALGQPQFPGITMNGGTFMGLPVVTSQYVTDGSPGGAIIIAVLPNEIFLADDGQVTVDVSREASLEMSNTPANNSATGQGANLVSMFQTNSLAIRAERFINWKRRREEAVQYLNNVAYSATGSPS